ncbi:MAG TPA: PH domain-containing protein [Solirubrobacteraceae bacterium]|nr:PH domain-containing protein [Solirubrobacteraceae bacterium]
MSGGPVGGGGPVSGGAATEGAASGAGPFPEPARPLGPGARPLWTLTALLRAIPLLVVAQLVAGGLRDASGVPSWIPSAVLVAAVGWALADVVLVPQLLWRRWRYALRDEELDLRHGVLTDVRTIVPVVRIQHVDTRRTVLSQLFGLAAVHVHTAAGTTSIPALPEAEAAAVRDRIARLARVPDEL